MGNKEHSGGSDPDWEVIDHGFAVLRDQARRYALYFLLEQETASVEELADVVTAWMEATSYGMATSQQRDRIHQTLVHQHLPILADSEIVDYDAGTNTVSLTPCPDAIREFVRLACLAETGS
ncbi:DUF7344 domain-containing protein [Halosolutus halophilus]|uniref:DUF7344 domain-containing protein n=1 Tax=Halosolutus halophilus TaxID=1552990 RepID=UPI0022352703|nr:hypothetical protein [Halosolutus halophilus]